MSQSRMMRPELRVGMVVEKIFFMNERLDGGDFDYVSKQYAARFKNND